MKRRSLSLELFTLSSQSDSETLSWHPLRLGRGQRVEQSFVTCRLLQNFILIASWEPLPTIPSCIRRHWSKLWCRGCEPDPWLSKTNKMKAFKTGQKEYERIDHVSLVAIPFKEWMYSTCFCGRLLEISSESWLGDCGFLKTTALTDHREIVFGLFFFFTPTELAWFCRYNVHPVQLSFAVEVHFVGPYLILEKK